MNNAAPLFGALLAGVLLGLVFFGGLWWTVQRGVASAHPVWWFVGSTLLRTALAVAGFYFVSGGDWQKLLICLLGFFIARVLVTRLTRSTGKEINAS